MRRVVSEAVARGEGSHIENCYREGAKSGNSSEECTGDLGTDACSFRRPGIWARQ